MSGIDADGIAKTEADHFKEFLRRRADGRVLLRRRTDRLSIHASHRRSRS
jgi:hypothetical protein